MQDERFIKQQRNSQGFRRYLKEPAVAAALTLGLLLVVLLALPGVRVQVADQLTASEMFLYGGDPGGDDDAPSKTKPTTEAEKSGALKKIVSAPVRLLARIFRGGGPSNNPTNNEAARNSEKTEKPKAAERPAVIVASRPANEVPVENSAPAKLNVEVNSIATSAAKLYDEAVEQHDKGRLDAAIEKLASSLVLNPNNAEAYNMLAVCYDEKGQYKNAQTEYKKALKLDPTNPRFLNNLGYSFYLAGAYGDSVKWYAKGLQTSPDDKRLHNNIGLAYGRKGDFTKARYHFTQAVGEFGASLNLGYVYSQHGKYDEAIKAYEAALQTQPNSLPALSNLAQLYERTGRLREASSLNEQYKKLAVTNQQKETSVDQ